MRSLILLSMSILLLAGLWWSRVSFSDTQENFLGQKERIELSTKKPVEQVVTARFNHLEQIKLSMGAAPLWVGESLTLQILDSTCQEELRHVRLHMLALHRQGPFVVFSFPPIIQSADHTYCLRLTYTSPYTKRKERPLVRAVEVPLSGAESLVTGKTEPVTTRSLQVRFGYGDSSAPDRLVTLEERLSQYKPAWIKGGLLFVGGISFLMTVLVAVSILCLRSPKD